jgi:RNA polymerase sigma-70 factor (ECF subfamily)
MPRGADVVIGTEPLVIREQFSSVLRAAQEGAGWAVAVLYRDVQPALVRYLRAQAPHEAEDLASETWLSVASGLGRFSGDEGAFRAWVFTIARCRLIDSFRRATRRPEHAVSWSDDVDRPAPDDTEAAALATVSTEAALARVAKLPPEQAEIVLLRILAGLSAEEVGAIVGKRPGTVRVLQHRALRRMARDLTTKRVTT